MAVIICVFVEIESSLKKRGMQSERKKLTQKKLTPTSPRTSNSISRFSKLKKIPLRRTRLSIQYSI